MIFLPMIAAANLNWSGPVIDTPGNHQWTGITASYIVPEFTPSAQEPKPGSSSGGGAVALWAGLGGGNGGKYSSTASRTLLQAGILAQQSPNGGIEQNLVWEFYNKPIHVDPPVFPGNQISIVIMPLVNEPNEDIVQDLDVTTGAATGRIVTVNGGFDTAEVVAESPMYANPNGTMMLRNVLPFAPENFTASFLSSPGGWQAYNSADTEMEPVDNYSMTWPTQSGTTNIITSSQSPGGGLWTWQQNAYWETANPPA